MAEDSSRFVYNFPKLTNTKDAKLLDVIKHLATEVAEAAYACGELDHSTATVRGNTSLRADMVAIELMDAMHAAETAIRRLEAEYEVNIDRIKCTVIAKNTERGYYV